MKTTIKNTAGISGLALLILASVSCDKNNPDNDRPTQFDLPAITAEITEFAKTKSLVGEDGIVKCSADDEIKVFVETQGTSVEDWEDVTHKYLTNANDCKSGLFKPETAYVIDNLDAKINMYVLNPWSDLVTDPVGDEESYSEFSYNGQIQDCNDITAHLSKYALMTGVAENVVAGQKPTVKMEHKSALLKFSVENQLRKPLTIQAVEITAPEGVNIAGTYKVDFKAGAPLVPVVPENKAMLTIRNGKVIGSDESMDIFIMTPPFSLSENQVIKLTVTSTEGEWEKVMTIPANIDIEAGSLNVTTIERNNYSVENIWTKTQSGLSLGTPNALGVAINNEYMFIQEYDGRCHLYDRNTGSYLKEVVQGGPYSFMINADVDDAGHFITCRDNVYGAGFIAFRYDADSDSQIELLNYTAGSGCPGDTYGFGVSGDLTKGKAYVYGSAAGVSKIFSWEFNNGVRVTPESDPVVIDIASAGGKCVICNADRVTPDSELYIAYFKEAEVPEEGGAVLEVLDNSNNVIATLDKANTLYRILDFKVCKLGNRKLLVTTEQGFARWDGVRTQVFDITDNSKLSLKPGDAGYEDFCLFTSPEIGVLNYNRWGNTSVYVDEANNEIYFTSGAVGAAETGEEDNQPTVVRLFKMKFFDE